MTTYEDINTSRRLMWAGIALGYGTAITIAILNVMSDDGSPLTALAFLAMLSIPSTMAVLSLDRRPSLRTTATMSALIVTVLLLFTPIGLVYLVAAILWYLAGQKRPRPAESPDWATWARPLLAAAIILPLLALFMHRDPQCTITDADGNVTVTSETEYPTGWGFSMTTTGTTTTEGDETRSCVSNTLVWWEGALSIALSAGIIVVAWRWPTAASLDPRGEIERVIAGPEVPSING